MLIQVLNCLTKSLKAESIWNEWLMDIDSNKFNIIVMLNQIGLISKIVATQNTFNELLFTKFIVFLTELSDVHE